MSIPPPSQSVASSTPLLTLLLVGHVYVPVAGVAAGVPNRPEGGHGVGVVDTASSCLASDLAGGQTQLTRFVTPG